MMKKGCLWILGLSLAVQTQLGAQTESVGIEPDLLKSRSLVVSASRVYDDEIEKDFYPGNVSVITREDIENSSANSIIDLLSQVPGMYISDSVGFGVGRVSVNLRGVGSGDKESTLILLNGIPLGQFVDNTIFWRSIPLSQVARIEVLKGAAAGTIYGQGALAGVINIVTIPAKGYESYEFEQTVGSFGQNTQDLQVQGSQGHLDYVFFANQEMWDGDRDNSEFNGSQYSLDMRYAADESSELRLYALSHENNTEVPGALSQVQEQQDREQRGPNNFGQSWNRQHYGSVSYSKKINESRQFDLTLYGKEQVNDSESPGFFSNIDQWGSGGSAVWRSDHHWLFDQALTFGFDWANDRARTQTNFEPGDSISDRSAWGVYAMQDIQLTEKTTWQWAYRFDQVRYDVSLFNFTLFDFFRSELNFDGHSPQASIKHRLSEKFSTYASYARSFKTPAILDIDAVGLNFVDNADLDPQVADQYEIGVSYDSEQQWRHNVSVFWLDVTDEVLFNNQNFQNQNFDTRRIGLEWDATWQATKKWLFGLKATWLHAFFRGGAFDDQKLPQNPRQRYTAIAQYKINDQWSCGADWLVVREHTRLNDFNGALGADNYHVLNAQIQYKRPTWSAFLKLNNILDAEYSEFQTSNGVAIAGGTENPAPGFSVVLGVKKSF